MADATAPGAEFALTRIYRDGIELPSIQTPDASLCAFMDVACRRHGEAIFLVDGDEQISFRQASAMSQSVARGLASGWSIRKGDRVGLAMRNSSAWIVAYMGIIASGAIAVLLNGWWEPGELSTAVERTGCTLVIADAPRAERLGRVPLPSALIVLNDELSCMAALQPIAQRACESDTLPRLSGDDGATILFTSGSTGQAKGAFSTHRSVLQATLAVALQSTVFAAVSEEIITTPQYTPVALLAVPLFHVTGEVVILLQSFALGRKIVVMRKWSAATAMELIERHKVTNFVGVALMSYELLMHPERDQFDLSSIRDYVAGGAPRPAEHVERLSTEMGDARPSLGYGLTETNALGSFNWRDLYRADPSGAGHPVAPLVDIAILDTAGRKLDAGHNGEIAIRSICTIDRYWGLPEATRDAFTADGYFLTGDIGRLDDDGRLIIVDRKKSIIIRGGENISPAEVEASIHALRDVRECIVFGLPDERLGERVAAAIHLEAGATLTTVEIVERLKGKLAAFKIPETIVLAPHPFPRLASEKVDRNGVKESALMALAAKT